MLRGTGINTRSMSVRTKLSLLMFVIIIFSVCFMAFINWLFLGNYYMYQTKQNYEKNFYKIKSAVKEAEASPIATITGLDYLAKEISSNNNCSVSFRYIDEKGSYFRFYAGTQPQILLISKLTEYLDNNFSENTKIDKQLDGARIQTVKETYGNTETTWIEMWGIIDKNLAFIIVSNYDDIVKLSQTSSQFVIIIGFICALISMILAYIIAYRFSKPIQDINKLTRDMSNMNFDKRYDGKSYREINELGNSVNHMSDRIESFINELKVSNTKLMHDVIKREEIDEMRKEFISNVSHELKTPIALIMGYAEGLKAGINDVDKEDREFYCDVIIDESKRMNSMVKDLLMLNELEFGKPQYYIEKFDIVDFVKNIIDSYKIVFDNKGIKVQFEQDVKHIDVWTDASKMETVIRNFITNAVNHIDENKLIIVKFKIQNNTKRVRLGIFNTGKPIEQSVKSRIWDKFYKVDKARTRSYGGNGIGLSIVKAILEPLKRPYGCVNRSNGVEFFLELDTTDTLVKKFNA